VVGPPAFVRWVVWAPQGTGRTTDFCSLGSLTATEVGLVISLCSTLDRLINGHKWILLARSMTPMWGHVYKTHWGFPEIKYTRKILSLFSSSSLFSWWFCCGVELLQACQHYSYHARGEGWAGSLNRCCCEARTRDGNKVSGQRNYATARSCTTTICAATRTFRIIYINDLLALLCANHPSADKTQS
jgi:hypothetical protein